MQEKKCFFESKQWYHATTKTNYIMAYSKVSPPPHGQDVFIKIAGPTVASVLREGSFFLVPFKKSLFLLCNNKEFTNVSVAVVQHAPFRVLRGGRCLHALVSRKKVRLCFDYFGWGCLRLLCALASHRIVVFFFTEGRSVTGCSSDGASHRDV